MDIETIEIKELMNDPANVRKHDERNLDSIKASLLRFGQQKPIVVDGKGIVVAGNGTLMGARSLGWKEIQIVRTELEGADAVAYAIADNRTAELAVWDEDALAQTLASLQIDDSIDELVTGFTKQEIEELIGKTVGLDDIEEDEVPEVPEEAITQVGDLWLLGEHRLLCGDTTSEDDVARLMDGEQIESVVTDPPYGMAFQSNHRKVKHRKIDGDGNESLLKIACETDSVFSKYIFCRWENLASIPRPKSVIVWVKNNWSMGDLEHEHARQTELIVFYSGKNHRWAKERPTDFVEARRTGNKLHPTQKPVELIAEIVGWCVGSILDPFTGSGTTLIACEQLNRQCYGMEIDPLYCDVIVKRWENLTGDTAQRVAVDSVQ